MAIDDFQRGSYQARIVEFPGRRKLTDVSTNESTVYDIELAEGNVTQSGTAWTPGVMVGLEERIQHSVEQIRNECNTKQDTLTAGSGISIDENNVISATGGGGGSSTLAGLDDTDISSPQNGQALIYDATSSKWVNANGGSGSATLAGLTDVTLTNPTQDQVLKYDGTKWVNGEGGGDATISKTVSGSVCSFSDGADGLPVKEIIAQVVAVQSGTGDPSPSNVRPISGWSSVNVKRCSKNLVDIASLATANITYSNGVLTGTGLAFSQAYSNGFISVPTTGQITVTLTARTTTGTTSNNGLVVRFKYTDGTQASLNFSNDTTTWETKTITSNVSKVVSYVLFTYAYESANTWEIKDLQVELGASSTAVEFYTGTNVTIALGQTVYGANLDVTSGVLTVTHAKITLDGTQTIRTTNWNPRTNTVGWLYSYSVTNNLLGTPRTSVPDIKCDSLTPTMYNSLSQSDIEGIGLYDTNYCGLVVRMADMSLNTESAINAYLSEHPIDVVFPLAQPVTVQLTPTEIETLLGINNIWADTGDTTVTYYTSSAEDVIDLVQYDTTKQDKLTAGTGISIDSNNVISATGGGGGAVIDDTTTSTTSVWSSSKTNSEIGATAAQILVPEFSTTKSYRSDDLCLHDGKFYMAITDISAGAWDATKWDEQTLHDVLEFYSEAAVAWADIDDLGNVQVDNLANGQVLKYNSTTQRWENANESGGGASALNDLSDVSVPSPTAGQVLTYQIAASVGQWVASTPPVPWFELTGTIPAAQDPTSPDTVSLVLRDSRITANSTVDVYTSVLGKNYVSLQVVTGRISISYVAGQSSFDVKVRVS